MLWATDLPRPSGKTVKKFSLAKEKASDCLHGCVVWHEVVCKDKAGTQAVELAKRSVNAFLITHVV